MIRFWRRWCVLGVVLLWPFENARGQPVIPLSLLPPDSREYLCFFPKPLVRSELYKQNGGSLEKTLGSINGLRELCDKAGFNITNDLDCLFIVSAGSTENNAAILMLASGRFNVQKLTAAFEEEVRKDKEHVSIVNERGIPCLRWASTIRNVTDELYLTVLDGRYAVLAPRDMFVAALDRYLATKVVVGLSKAVAAAVEPTDPSLVFAMQLGSATVRQYMGAADPRTIQLLEKVTLVRGSIRMATRFNLELALDAADADSAKELKEPINQLINQLKAYIDLFVLNLPEAKPLAELRDKSVLTVRGKTLTFTMEFTSEMVRAASEVYTRLNARMKELAK